MSRPALVLDIGVYFFAYGGNGGISMEVPQIRDWWAKTLLKMKADPRIGKIESRTISDTPITMTRNQAVAESLAKGHHLILMIDSDQHPDKHEGESWYKPFWDVAFAAVYDHYLKGPLVVGAPYCGPPGENGENVYVFEWETHSGVHADNSTKFKLEQVSRQVAARSSGIQPCAALPTGLILFDSRAFELIKPSGRRQREVLEDLVEKKIDIDKAMAQLTEGWFRYEWRDSLATHKASTEDVQCTRDIAIACYVKKGYNPIRVAWDSWIGHVKPWVVGKPKIYDTDSVGALFRDIAVEAHDSRDRIVNISDQTEDLFKNNPVAKAPLEAVGVDNDGSVKPLEDLSPAEIAREHQTDPQHVKVLQCLAAELITTNDDAYVELGCFDGRTLEAMLDKRVTGYYVGVDTFEGSPTDHTSALVTRMGGKHCLKQLIHERLGTHPHSAWYALFEKDVVAAAPIFRSHTAKSPRLVFLDAEHTYEATRDAINAWRDTLLEDATSVSVLCVHDVNVKQFPGVDQAVAECFREFTLVAPGRMGAIAAVMFHHGKCSQLEGPALNCLRSNGVIVADAKFAEYEGHRTLHASQR